MSIANIKPERRSYPLSTRRSAQRREFDSQSGDDSQIMLTICVAFIAGVIIGACYRLVLVLLGASL